MSEKEIKVLLEAAQVARMDPSNLKPLNPFSQNGTTAQTLQMAVQQVDPILAARWRNEAGESISLASAAAKAGLRPMTQSTHNELSSLDADYLAGQQEAAARREAQLLAGMEEATAELAAKREKQTQEFARQAGKNTAGGQFNREFVQRWGGAEQLSRTPARKLLGQ